ncbi:hypothetical protein Tco_0965259 [Tanacetum coccineum]
MHQYFEEWIRTTIQERPTYYDPFVSVMIDTAFCGLQSIVAMNNGLAIHMLTEKKYPLSQEMLSKMLSTRLEVDHESSQAFELLRFIRAQVQK